MAKIFHSLEGYFIVKKASRSVKTGKRMEHFYVSDNSRPFISYENGMYTAQKKDQKKYPKKPTKLFLNSNQKEQRLAYYQ